MIVLRINKPEKDIWPHWAPGMDHLDGAEFIFNPDSVDARRKSIDPIYLLDFQHIFLTHADMSLDYKWNLNTKWLEVVRTDGEDLSDLEKVGIDISDICRFKGPVTLSNLGTYHDSSTS